MNVPLTSAVLVKWLFQEGNWSWRCIQSFVLWREEVGWRSALRFLQTLSPEELCERWRWSEGGVPESRQQKSFEWLSEQVQRCSLSPEFLDDWYRRKKEREWFWCTPFDLWYPSLLRNLEDPPPVLWCSQDISLDIIESGFFGKASLAVVGSRRVTAYGRLGTQDFVRSFARDFQIPIVSGAAYGVDAIAHDTCLQHGGKTIAVLPHGCRQLPNRLQPWLEHPDFLALTEFPPDFPVERWQFAQRNRLIAGLSVAVIVIEAGKKSGTLLTSASAFLQGKEVFVLTQPRQSVQMEGVLTLLENGAHLVATPQDIWKHLVPFQSTTKIAGEEYGQLVLQQGHTPLERAIIQALLEKNGRVVTEHCRQMVHQHLEEPSDWPRALLTLELKGVLQQEFGVLQLIGGKS